MYRNIIKYSSKPTKKIWIDHLKKFIVVKNNKKNIKEMYKLLENI